MVKQLTLLVRGGGFEFGFFHLLDFKPGALSQYYQVHVEWAVIHVQERHIHKNN